MTPGHSTFAFDGCKIGVSGGGGYNDWQQSNEPNFTLAAPSVDKIIPYSTMTFSYITTIDLPVTISLNGGSLISNTVDGELAFRGSISNWWSKDESIDFKIEYTYKD